MTTKFQYDGDSRMSDMITAHPQLVMLLHRFGLTLGLGDRTVDTVCRSHGVDTAFFVLVCGVYATGGIVPRDAVAVTPLCQLVPYLQRSHEYYLERRLPHIEAHLHHIADRLPARAADALLRFFEEYKREMSEHFAREERAVFPHIIALQDGTDTAYSIDEFAIHHDNVDEKLEDLLQIIFKYLPADDIDDDSDTVSVVYDILQLSNDLRCHATIEDKVMVPYVRRMEQEVKQ